MAMRINKSWQQSMIAKLYDSSSISTIPPNQISTPHSNNLFAANSDSVYGVAVIFHRYDVVSDENNVGWNDICYGKIFTLPKSRKR
jgi:hypothetical protein